VFEFGLNANTGRHREQRENIHPAVGSPPDDPYRTRQPLGRQYDFVACSKLALQHQLGFFVAGPGMSSSPRTRRMRRQRPCFIHDSWRPPLVQAPARSGRAAGHTVPRPPPHLREHSARQGRQHQHRLQDARALLGEGHPRRLQAPDAGDAGRGPGAPWRGVLLAPATPIVVDGLAARSYMSDEICRFAGL